MEKKATQVVAALIWQGDRFMICQRPEHKARGLLWEFVGGKIEEGETGEQALARECREEMDVAVSVGNIFTEVTHEYEDLLVHLTVYNAEITEGEPKLLEHRDIRYILAEEIPQYEFCGADDSILKKIALYFSQKKILELFLERNAIDRAQYNKSLGDLTEKMGFPFNHR